MWTNRALAQAVAGGVGTVVPSALATRSTQDVVCKECCPVERDPILERLFNLQPAAEPAVKRSMTRGEQTAWIVATLIVLFVAGVVIFITRTDPTDTYPECWPLYTQACKAEVATERLM